MIISSYLNCRTTCRLRSIAIVKPCRANFKDSVGKDLKKNLVELSTLIYKTKTTTEELTLIEEILGCLEVIGLRIRLLSGFNQLSVEQFTLVSDLTDEIYRQMLTRRKNIKKEWHE
jgi:hypothetical protein